MTTPLGPERFMPEQHGPGSTQRLWAGILWGFGAAAIWSGWWVATRSSVTGGLAGPDLAALRFGVAGALLLPVILRNCARLARVPLRLLIVMAFGSGAPYALIAGLGLKFASAGNGGALTLGMLPVFTALLTALVVGEGISRSRILGLAVIALGALSIVGPGLGVAGAWQGHIIFVFGAAMWAAFTVSMRLSGLDAITATAVVCVFSAAGYLPVYMTVIGPEALMTAPARELVFQAIYQGGLSAIGALFCYCRAIEALGTTRAAVFGAAVPAMTTVLGAAVLAESPSAAETAGVVLLSLGIHVAARGPAAQKTQIPRSAHRIPTLAQPLAPTPAHDIGAIAARSGA